MEKQKDPIAKLIALAEKSGDKELQKAAKEAKPYMKKILSAVARVEKKLGNVETLQRFLLHLGK